MARLLVVYHRGLHLGWRATYQSHLMSLSRFSDHECVYLNTARARIPRYIKSFRPDLVVFHYTFLAIRQDPPVFVKLMKRVRFIKDLDCPKALVPHDEQTHSDTLCSVVEEFGVTHIFTPASPPQWPLIYEGLDLEKLHLRTVLTGYVDDSTVALIARRRSRQRGDRSIDIGYRAWDSYPFYGRHGQLKGEIGRVFAEAAPRAGLTVDISSSHKDALMGNRWFDFLLNCKYTVGVEGGSSIFDRDGSISVRTMDYMKAHPGETFGQVEAACFPGADGSFSYRLLGPRHLEAVMTKTCQVLIEGEYGGVLEPGTHYIELKRDFSNLPEVLEWMKDDRRRATTVERAYRDVIDSGQYSYRRFAEILLGDALPKERLTHEGSVPRTSPVVTLNRVDEAVWRVVTRPLGKVADAARRTVYDGLSAAIGRDRVRRMISKLRALRSRTAGSSR